MKKQTINAYGHQLTQEEISAGAHRGFVGGMWEEIGGLQFNFLRDVGLKPTHRLLDVGCGSLRGGIHFLDYLDQGRYYGIDINESLILAGEEEIAAAGLQAKDAHLLVNDEFDFGKFAQCFDFALAVSVFTHLPFNNIVRCLVQVEKVLTADGKFYATFFQAPRSGYILPLGHDPGGIVTQYDEDPYHQSFDEIRFMAGIARLRVELVGDWQHPRNQRMVCFSKESS